MVSIQTRAHIDKNGRLDVELPAEYRDTSVNVTITLEPLAHDEPIRSSPDLHAESDVWQQARQESESMIANWEGAPRDKNGWPLGFLDAMYGCLADDPIERLPQGELEVREEID